MGEEQLCLRELNAWYGESHVLHGVNMTVRRGELVTLLGRNGAGRSSTLRAIMNMVGRRSGDILIKGQDSMGLAPHRIAHLGVGFCPEERGIFASLSVEENLLLPPLVRSTGHGQSQGQSQSQSQSQSQGQGHSQSQGQGMSLDELYALFPNLHERRTSQGTRLSGGEQQMLALARILRTGADLLLLDEITEGLAPVINQKLAEVLMMLKARGMTIVLVEQNFRFAAPLADRHYLMEHGTILEEISAAELPARHEYLHKVLGV
ncbi:ABC transporter ATP-binding protein [Cobetia amphilecti]|uniref:ABC transporter ATP-binding protein n=1 Tax=Cobetia amphilecti TaxID=1055104 RepID=A0AAP4WWK4_9GAMM|nr:ABC transporter ATP-binding protein [Cobetia amphilecti]MDO6673205.1 ABC transporter ATP-binding protein [Cobetia amphilecti]